jgi:hypothetical protein
MSSDESPPPLLPPSPPSEKRSGCLTAVMVVFGIIMLLPGLCALLFTGISIFSDGRFDSSIGSFVALGLLVGAFGVLLIWAAIRGRNG